jgi:hypothetical protein
MLVSWTPATVRESCGRTPTLAASQAAKGGWSRKPDQSQDEHEPTRNRRRTHQASDSDASPSRCLCHALSFCRIGVIIVVRLSVRLSAAMASQVLCTSTLRYRVGTGGWATRTVESICSSCDSPCSSPDRSTCGSACFSCDSTI